MSGGTFVDWARTMSVAPILSSPATMSRFMSAPLEKTTTSIHCHPQGPGKSEREGREGKEEVTKTSELRDLGSPFVTFVFASPGLKMTVINHRRTPSADPAPVPCSSRKSHPTGGSDMQGP